MKTPVTGELLISLLTPLRQDDPVYGTGDGRQGSYHGLSLGALQPRGETHLLTVPLSQLLRLRRNSFFACVERRIVEVIDSTADPIVGRPSKIDRPQSTDIDGL